MRSLAALVLVLAPVVAHGQAMVEYGAAVGRSGVAGARGTGKSVGKVFEKAAQELNRAAGQTAQAPAKTEAPAKAEAPAPPAATAATEKAVSTAAAIDPAAIQVGMTREELFQRFGKPATRITQQQGSEMIEKCWYKAPGFEPVVVVLKNGKVASVTSVVS
jgi:hypothetical protein